MSKDRCQEFLEMATNGSRGTQPPSYAVGYANSFYRRRVVGHVFDDDKKLTFRRLSNNRRIFGVVPVSILSYRDGSEINTNQCYCPSCLGGGIVKMKPYEEDDYITYCEHGEIKG